MRCQRSNLWIALTFSLWWEVDSCTKDSKSIGVCLHIYLERDFTAIDVNHRREGKEFAEDRHENGPQLVSHCESLGEALKCFKENLNDCYNIQHFQEYRQLLDGLSKTYEWLCDEHYLRVRFLVLLKSMNCLETVRMSSSTCSSSAVTQNIWQKILRLETDHEICPVLQWQRDCLLQPNQLTQCGPRADDVYKNMSEIFLESWCNMSPVATHIPVSILIALIFIVQYLVI